jgi:hypothetical protein
MLEPTIGFAIWIKTVGETNPFDYSLFESRIVILFGLASLVDELQRGLRSAWYR